ncbi:MAG: hypothetical protein WC378_01955 [Opitutaceae bacterium]|jgi:Na+/proline symporter
MTAIIPQLALPLPLLSTIQVADRPVVYAVAVGYLLTLVCIGLAFSRFSKNTSDYFRAGGQATWWLVGGSAFMGNFSVWTFTGAASAAYQGGWSVVLMYGSGVLAYLLLSLRPAAWFRQTRMVTSADVIRMRFGTGMEQLFATLQAVAAPLGGGVQLYALAIFTTSLLGFDIRVTIIVLGTVVLFYTALSGAWAVLAADFLKGLILLPITMLVAVVCLAKIGGIGGLLHGITAAGLDAAYSPIKSPVEAAAMKGLPAGYFTLGFIMAYYGAQLVQLNGLSNAGKFLAVKDGREARRTALFTAILLFVGMFIFFIPPMVARLLLPNEVAAMPLIRPEEGAYAAAAMHFLPVGLVALVLVAMCASTMSTLDLTLTGLAGMITQNIYPALCRRFKRTPLEGRPRLMLGKAVNVCCSLTVITSALIMASLGSVGVFSLLIDIISLVLVPLAVPMLWGLFVRRVPNCAAPVAVITGVVVSSFIVGLPKLLGTTPWTYQEQIFTMFAASTLAFFGARFVHRGDDPEVTAREKEFFGNRDRPVDFSAEIGTGNDGRQMRIVGIFAFLMGVAIFLLIIPASSAGHWGKIFCISGTIATVGALLLYLGYRRKGTP